MEILTHTVELLEDPFGLLEGDRYEFFLNVNVEEDDELYTEKGLLLKVIFLVNGEDQRILQHYFIENKTERVLDFELEEEEKTEVTSYCLTHLPHVE